jgi:hypothetical protein
MQSDPNENTLLSMVLPKEALRGGSIYFYLHVVDLLAGTEHADMTLAFARLALNHLDQVTDVSASTRACPSVHGLTLPMLLA